MMPTSDDLLIKPLGFCIMMERAMTGEVMLLTTIILACRFSCLIWLIKESEVRSPR